MKEDKSGWASEADMTYAFKKDPELCAKAVVFFIDRSHLCTNLFSFLHVPTAED